LLALCSHTLRALAARTACGLLVLLLRPLLRGLPRGVDALFAGAPRAELATVMIVCPLCMNLAQAWIQDAALKFSHAGAAAGDAPARQAVKRSGAGSLDAVREARPSEEGVGCDGDAEEEGEEGGLLGRSGSGGSGGSGARAGVYRGDS
jgi:hypothetical protein